MSFPAFAERLLIRLKGVVIGRCIAIALLLPSFLPGMAAACADGCSGTCEIGFQASGTFLDPAYVASAPAVSTPTLAALLAAGTPLALIDCRTADSLAGPRIPGAMVFLTGSKPEGMAERFPAKDILMILYDGGSSTEQIGVRKELSAVGFTNILQYPAGIPGWIAAGHPTVPAASDSLLSLQSAP